MVTSHIGIWKFQISDISNMIILMIVIDIDMVILRIVIWLPQLYLYDSLTDSNTVTSMIVIWLPQS